MKLRTKLHIGTVLTTTLVAAFVGTMLFYLSVITYAYEKQKVAEQIAEKAYQSSQLRSEYVRSPGERPKAQWVNVFAAQETLFEGSESLFTGPEEKMLLEEIRTAAARGRDLFQELVRTTEQNGSPIIIQELSNQLSIKSETKISNALHLAEISRKSASDAGKSLFIIILVLGMALLVIAIASHVFGVQIAESIHVLREGTKIVAGGNFDYQLNMPRQDEIGELASFFNVMTRHVAVSHKEEAMNAKKFQQAVEASADAVAITHPDMTYAYINPAWSKLTGYAPEEAMHKTPRMLLSEKTNPELVQRFLADDAKGKQEGAVFQSEDLLYRRKNGTEYSVAMTKYAIWEDGKVLFYVLVHRDITERKRIDRTKSAFISLASHELRTPLTRMRWALGGLRASSPLNDEQKPLVEEAYASSVYMADIIRMMLQLSQVESKGLEPEPVEIALPALCEQAVRDVERQQKERGIAVSVSCPLGGAFTSDQHLLLQILVNLLSNAYKYTPPGGKVRLEAHVTPGGARIVVADEGIGIPLSEQGKVGSMFFRATNVLDKEEGGMGIGLHLVYAFVRLIGGTISFTSHEDTGTTFTVDLPSLSPPAP